MDETLASKPSMSNCNTAEISILYGSITVHTETVDCTVGCRIFYGPIPNSENIDPVLQEELFGPQDAVQIALNPIHPLPAAEELFSLLRRGLIVKVKNGNVFVTSLSPVIVYYGANPYGECRPLIREKSTCVFDYSKHFLPALSRDTPISPYTILSIGQKWTPTTPSVYNMISVIIMPILAEEAIAQLDDVNLVPMISKLGATKKILYSE